MQALRFADAGWKQVVSRLATFGCRVKVSETVRVCCTANHMVLSPFFVGYDYLLHSPGDAFLIFREMYVVAFFNDVAVVVRLCGIGVSVIERWRMLVC